MTSMLTKVMTTFYRRMVFLVYPLQEDPIPVLSSRLPVEIGTLDEEELEAYLRCRPRQDPATVRARFERGDRCFVCRYEGEIVDVGWTTTRRRIHVPYLRRDLQLAPGDVYCYDAFTRPSMRGHGLHMARNAFTGRHYRDEGCRRGVALVALENRTSWKTLQHAGLTNEGTYACLRLGPWQTHWKRSRNGTALPSLCVPEEAVNGS